MEVLSNMFLWKEETCHNLYLFSQFHSCLHMSFKHIIMRVWYSVAPWQTPLKDIKEKKDSYNILKYIVE